MVGGKIKIVSKISTVINTLNEEKNLQRAIVSVRDFSDEIVVVDMMSSDKTRDIAKKFGAKVYEYKRVGYVEPARNFAISKATGEWIFILDADEEVPMTLAKKIKELVKKSDADYYRIPRKNIIFKKWMKHSRWWPDYNIRFFQKGFVIWNEVIHSVPMTQGKGKDLPSEEELSIVHFHYDSLEQYIDRLNRYTSEHAKIIIEKGYKFSWVDLIKKPTDEFLSRYFFGEGYKDGLHGLALSLLQAFSELVLYLKIWQLADFEEEDLNVLEIIDRLKKSESDFHYWEADTELKNGGGIKARIKRKFKLP